MEKKKILITGSCGFLANNLIRKIIYEKHPYQIVSLDKCNINTLNSIYWNTNHKFYVADVTDYHILDMIFQLEKPDIVIHTAESSSEPNELLNTNIIGTQNIIDLCIKYGTEKLVYTSTCGVYGEHLSETEDPWTELSPISPKNPYSISKASAEFLIQSTSRSHGLNYNIIRSVNSYGPRQNPNRLIPKVIQCILKNQPIPIYGQGLQIRDWLHLFDNCAAILKIISDGTPNEIYNVGANQEFSNIEVVQKICNIMETGHSLVSFVQDKPNHDFGYFVNCNKVKKMGWEPNYKFKNGLSDSINWFINNKWWLGIKE